MIVGSEAWCVQLIIGEFSYLEPVKENLIYMINLSNNPSKNYKYITFLLMQQCPWCCSDHGATVTMVPQWLWCSRGNGVAVTVVSQ